MLHRILKNGLYQLELPLIQRSSTKVGSSIKVCSSTSPVAAVSESFNKSTDSLSAVFQVDSSKSSKVPKSVWHRRLGHASDRIVNSIIKSCNLNASINEKADFCDACQLGKSYRLPFIRSVSKSSHPLALIHCDLWGPSPVASTSGYRFYISFVDDYSRLTHIFPLKFKSEALTAFQQYKS